MQERSVIRSLEIPVTNSEGRLYGARLFRLVQSLNRFGEIPAQLGMLRRIAPVLPRLDRDQVAHSVAFQFNVNRPAVSRKYTCGVNFAHT
jgi:hypothetical protein